MYYFNLSVLGCPRLRSCLTSLFVRMTCDPIGSSPTCRSPIVFSFTNCAALRQWNCFLSHRVGWDHILPRHHTVQVRAWNRIKISILYVVMRTARSVLLCFVLDINLFWTLQTWRTQLQPVIVVASVEDSETEAGKWFSKKSRKVILNLSHARKKSPA